MELKQETPMCEIKVNWLEKSGNCFNQMTYLLVIHTKFSSTSLISQKAHLFLNEARQGQELEISYNLFNVQKTHQNNFTLIFKHSIIFLFLKTRK